MTPRNNNRSLWAELAHRGVYQSVGLYVAVAWGSIEILITSSERLGWPAWLGDALLILFLTGLPFVVLLSWAFDLTGSGIERMEAGSIRGKVMIAAMLTGIVGLSATWFILRDSSPKTPLQAGVDPAGRPVIAIMPFQDLTGASNQEWLALSFTDEVINRINAHPDLVALDLQTVTSPLLSQSSAAIFGPRADYVVQGRLLKAPVGTLMRVRMSDSDGNVIWETERTRKLDDPLVIRAEQQFMAGQLAAGVGVTLTGKDYCEPSPIAEASTLYYQAREHFARRGPEHVALAALKLEKAVQLDPDYARALDLLASVYERFPTHVRRDPGHYGLSLDELDAFLAEQPGLTMSRRALDRCPSLASSYFAVETSAAVELTFADALDIMEEALRREPANLDLRSRSIDLLLRVGHIRAAREIASEMYLRDPLNPRHPHVLSWVEYLLGNDERGWALENEALELGYTFANALPGMAINLVALGDEQALTQLMDNNWSPSVQLPLDPRQVVRAREDPALRAQLIGEYHALLDAGDLEVLRRVVGTWGPSLAFELGDAALAWRAMTLWAERADPAAIPPCLWHARYRHWFGNQRMLELGEYGVQWSDFWDRRGAPDDCSWDGKALLCEYADSP